MRLIAGCLVMVRTATVGLTGCETIQENWKTAIGAGAGAVGGAVVGGLIGQGTTGVVIGGLLGTLAGGAIGQYLDRDARGAPQWHAGREPDHRVCAPGWDLHQLRADYAAGHRNHRGL